MAKLIKPPKKKQHVMALRLKDRDEIMLDELSKAYNAPKAVIVRMAIRHMHQNMGQIHHRFFETREEE